MTTAEQDDARRWGEVEEATELLHEERFREAMVQLRDVIKRDPRNAYAYYFLGIAFFEIGEMESARDAYAACVKLAPGHLGARVALSHVLRMLGDTKGAVREGMAVLERAPNDPDALHAIGLAHHARGDAGGARRYLEAYLATKPEFEVALETRALLETLPGGKKPPKPDEEEDD